MASVNGVEIVIDAIDLASGVIKGIAGAFDFVVDSAKDFVMAASEAQEVEAKFDAIVKNSPLAGYSKEMKQLATDFSTLTRFEDEQILSAETVLLQFQNISKEAMPDAVAATLDIAEVMGTDATNAARVLGRALEDPFNAARSLRQMNIILSDEQQAQMKVWEKNGDAASASAFIMDTLKSKIGNVAEEMGNTFAGKMTIFQNTIENIKEELGGQLLPVLTPIVAKFGELAIQYAPLLADAFRTIIPYVTQFADIFFSLLSGGSLNLGAFQAGFDAISNWWIVNSPMIIGFISGLWDSLSAFLMDVGAKIGPLLIDKFNEFAAWLIINTPLIKEYMTVLGDNFRILLDAVMVVINTLLPLMSGMFTIILQSATLFMQILTGDWAGAWGSIKTIASTAVTAIIVALGAFFDGVLQMMGSSGAEFVAVWYSNFLQLVNIVGQVGSILRQKISMFIDIGRSFITGLIQGVQSMIGSMISTLVNAAQSAVSAVKSVLKIRSPSEVFADIGENIMAGMAQGIAGSQNLPSGALMGASNSLIASSGGSSGSVINVNISTPALIGSGSAARDALLPILREGVRQLQAEGALPL